MKRNRGSRLQRAARRQRAPVISFAVLPALAAGAPYSTLANPHGGNVVAGTATITRAGKTLTVNQSSDRAVINWRGFSIGNGQTTQINLPSSVSAILNRVTGANPSLIAGSLSSNGQVYLINPNGIVVGPNGRINTAGFVASTLNLQNDTFMAGGGLTFKGDSGAGIKILGSVTASDGDVVLIAAMVDNQGQIAAPNGQAILGSGGEVFYIPDGQSDIVIKAPANGGGGVTNSGTIAAASVQMKAAGSAYALAVNNSGLVTATGISQRGGRIVLDSGDGDVVQSGTLTAASGSATLNGGQVTVSGTVDVSAPTGGGNIAITASKKATVTKTAKLNASATTIGNGGKITVKSQGSADVEGSIEAKGGPQGGDGGSAEVSAPEVTYHGHVDLTAPQGQIGQFLLDPADVTICFTCALTPADINDALNGSDFTVLADNSITGNTAISSNFAQTLTLDAPNTTLNAGISLPNGALKFANSSATTNGTISAAGGAITAPSVQVVGNYATVNLANAANVISTLHFIGGATVSGGFTFSTLGALDLQGGTLSAGAITILSAGDLTVEANTGLDSNGTKTLGSVGGTFINNDGAGLFTGAGHNRIYAATDAGYVDGGLGFIRYNPVTIGSDPLPTLMDAAYIAHSTTLPPMTVTAIPVSRVYGAPDPAFSAFFSGDTSADFIPGVPLQFRITNGPDGNAGTYTIQPFGAISAGRALTFATGTLTVTPAVLTVTANDTTRLQGAGVPAFSDHISGLVNGDTTSNILVFFESQGFSTSPPGSYAIQPFGFSQDPNYTLQFVNGTLTIVAPPPPTPASIYLAPVTYLPATLTTTTTTFETTQTLTPTTLTQEEVNPVTTAITVNPLIGTPLQLFGPLAATVLDQFAAAFDPPADEGTILVALKSPEIAPTIMALLDNYMMIELDTILDKDPKTWTADETAFVNGFLSYINAQRAAAAEKAEADYEAWAKATVAAEDAKIKQDTGEVQLMEMAALSANPPVPPGDFLAEASAGMVLTDSQSDLVIAQIGASADAADVLNGTASAAYLAYLAGDAFQMGGKGLQIVTVIKTIGNATKEIKVGGGITSYKAMTPEQRAEWRAKYRNNTSPKSGGETSSETSSETTKGTNTATETGKVTTTSTETTTDTTKVTTTTSRTLLAAADTLEAIGRVVAVAGIAGEAAAIVLQTAATATEYAEQASYNDAFSAAGNNAMKPISVSDLKTMVSSGEAMTYLMAAMASGNPNAIDSGNILNTAKPDMPLSQILAIEKNF